MPITQVNEIWQGRSGSGDLKSGRRYSRVFRVLTNSNFDTAVEATATGTPVIGNLFPSDNTAFCQNVTATQEAFSPRVWIVTATYSTEQEVTDNPLGDPTEYVWGTEQFQRPYFKDRSGNAILNSAGDPYDPPVDGDDSRTSVTMTRNVSTVPAWFLDTRDKLNSAPYNVGGIGVAAERAKIQKVTAGKQQSRNQIEFITISATLHVQSESWQKSILDAGFRKKDGTDRKKITNDDGTEPSSPVPLDGSGGVLADPTTTNAVFKDFDIYGTFDFNELPF